MEDTNEVIKKSIKQRAIDFLNGSDEVLIGKFYDKDLKKYVEKQVKEIADRIGDYESEIEDAFGEHDNAEAAVNVEELKSTVLRKAYAPVYVKSLDVILDQIFDLEEKIEDDKVLLKRRKDLLAKLS